jgi:hypothetical protein
MAVSLLTGVSQLRPQPQEANPRGNRREGLPVLDRRSKKETAMGKGKMSGDNAADSKRGAARGSGGTTKKSQNAGKQHNTKADNTKTNRQ